MSQYELAKTLDISRQAVSKWENDQSAPDTLNLIRLSELLNTEVEYLATGKKPKYTQPVVVEKIVEVEKLVKVPETVTVERVIRVPEFIEKPIVKLKYRTKYIRNPIEFAVIGIISLIIGLVIGLFL